jgi:hypothetical protein
MTGLEMEFSDNSFGECYVITQFCLLAGSNLERYSAFFTFGVLKAVRGAGDAKTSGLHHL